MSNVLTHEELLFLKRAAALASFFPKIVEAKRLIAEVQVDFEKTIRRLSLSLPAAKPKAKTPAKTGKPVSFGVDVPESLTNGERAVYTALRQTGKDGRRPRELAAALKLSIPIIGRATKSLKKRKLIRSRGKTTNLMWFI